MPHPTSLERLSRPLLALFLLGTLVSCLPSSTAPPPLAFSPLERPQYVALVEPFFPTLERLGVTLERGSGYGYGGSEPGAFGQALERFRQFSEGFCPLEGGFVPLGEEAMYLTVTARGRELRLFVYDQRARPALRYALLEGRSREPLPTRGCVR